MKKTFSLKSERHQPARVVEQIKSEVRKYLKRERGKKLGEEYDYWAFNCRTGQTVEEAKGCHEKEIGKALDAALEAKWESIYLEIFSRQMKRGSQNEE